MLSSFLQTSPLPLCALLPAFSLDANKANCMRHHSDRLRARSATLAVKADVPSSSPGPVLAPFSTTTLRRPYSEPGSGPSAVRRATLASGGRLPNKATHVPRIHTRVRETSWRKCIPTPECRKKTVRPTANLHAWWSTRHGAATDVRTANEADGRAVLSYQSTGTGSNFQSPFGSTFL
ncbi:hypothetical protein BJV78DRAFT_1152568 [Lactifluus subvellereus]|nr:hypothetical protein BJV78DRAFT_1152568 [Lactifluus subvellereus]